MRFKARIYILLIRSCCCKFGMWSHILGDGKLFPNVSSMFIFLLYMSLFIAQGIFVTASREGKKEYSYNTTTVVLLTESIKLVISLFIFFHSGHRVSDFAEYLRSHGAMLAYYFIPAGLYAIYNNLSFFSLAKFDPTTYFILLQFRVIVNGVIFQWLFNKRLSPVQWLSLLVLTFGCILKEFHKVAESVTSSMKQTEWQHGLVLIGVQVLASTFAGVYNEYLLKDKGPEVNMWFQNFCMYFDSIVCNLLALFLRGDFLNAFSSTSMKQIFHFKVVAIICDNAAIGIVTALFLKNLNSILKSFASSLEIMFTAILCWIIFSIPIDEYTVGAIVVVSLALGLYAKNPVVNPPKQSNEEEKPIITSSPPTNGQLAAV